MPAKRTMLMTANEAASVTGVPLRQVHRIIDAGLLDGARLVAAKALTICLPRNAAGLLAGPDEAMAEDRSYFSLTGQRNEP